MERLLGICGFELTPEELEALKPFLQELQKQPDPRKMNAPNRRQRLFIQQFADNLHVQVAYLQKPCFEFHNQQPRGQKVFCLQLTIPTRTSLPLGMHTEYRTESFSLVPCWHDTRHAGNTDSRKLPS